ncbi:hypothetical protein GCM10009639_18620 [Kitasatospora putterlickiae]|uniref:Integral membrane protein n=1 Tax=Kitasatospora putterlickiae TaxID=221725 RepID=A0ABN1XTY8_9ACTN
MAIAADKAQPEEGERTGPAGRLLRVIASLHTIAVFGQPVFAGIYLTGDFDGLRWHGQGANVTTYFSYLQLAVAAAVWNRSRRSWPFSCTLAVVLAESAQYVAGLKGALWLHLPLGVTTVAGVVVLTIALWRAPLPARAERRRGAGDE